MCIFDWLAFLKAKKRWCTFRQYVHYELSGRKNIVGYGGWCLSMIKTSSAGDNFGMSSVIIDMPRAIAAYGSDGAIMFANDR